MAVTKDQLISTLKPKDLALYIAPYTDQGNYNDNLTAARTAIALRRTGRIQEAASSYDLTTWTASGGAFDAGIKPLAYVNGAKTITPYASDVPGSGTITFASALASGSTVVLDLERPVRGVASYSPTHRMPNEIQQLFAWGSDDPVEKQIRKGDEEIRGAAEIAWDFDENRNRYPGREIFISLWGSDFPTALDTDFRIGAGSNPFAVLAVYFRPNPSSGGIARVEDLMIGCSLTSPPPQYPQSGRGQTGRFSIEWDATDRILKYVPEP